MSGASGKIPAAIHVTPEALDGGVVGKICDGDLVRLDAEAGVLQCDADFAMRDTPGHEIDADRWGTGRELFAGFRAAVGEAETGAMTFHLEERDV